MPQSEQDPATHRQVIDSAWDHLGSIDPGAAQKAVTALPRDAAGTVEGLRFAGRAAWRQGLPEAAMTLLADAIAAAEADDDADPGTQAAALTDLAVMQMETGQTALAERLLGMALDLDPRLPEALSALAALAEDAGDTETALARLREACAAATA